jgi:transposase-like protein
MPGSKSVKELSKETGISTGTLHNWLREAKSGGTENMNDLRNWTLTEKLDALIKSASLQGEEYGKWLRENGIHTEHLKLWKDELDKVLSVTLKETKHELAENKSKNKILAKEITKKDKAISELSTLLILKKKHKILFEGEEK